MIRTSLRIYPTPDDFLVFNMMACGTNVGAGENFYNYLKGEPYIPSVAELVLEDMHSVAMNATEEYRRRKCYQYDGHVVIVICSDGDRSLDEEVLKGAFSFFHDFTSEFPGCPVKLPCTIEIFFKCLWGLGLGDCVPLTDVLEMLHFLNPKDPSYYFRYDTTGATPEVLLELTRKLTEENRIHIVEAWRATGRPYSLPREGMGHGILAAILLSYGDYTNLATIFHDYPSFIFVFLEDNKEVTKYLLTKDFTDGLWLYPEEYRETILRAIIVALEDEELTTCQITRLLSMLGVHDPLFDAREGSVKYEGYSEDKVSGVVVHGDYKPLIVRAPFGIRLSCSLGPYLGDKTTYTHRASICRNIAEKFSLDERLVKRQIDIIIGFPSTRLS